MREVYRLHNSLLHENRIDITNLEARKIPIDNEIDISILLEFDLYNLDIHDIIIGQFDELTAYLDSVS